MISIRRETNYTMVPKYYRVGIYYRYRHAFADRVTCTSYIYARAAIVPSRALEKIQILPGGVLLRYKHEGRGIGIGIRRVQNHAIYAFPRGVVYTAIAVTHYFVYTRRTRYENRLDAGRYITRFTRISETTTQQYIVLYERVYICTKCIQHIYVCMYRTYRTINDNENNIIV